jgi:antitoxin CcdA
MKGRPGGAALFLCGACHRAKAASPYGGNAAEDGMSHIGKRDAGYDAKASKRRVDITLNEDLLRLAEGYTDNLSDTIESLLAAWMQDERRKSDNDLEHRRKVAAAWNAFDEKHGRFADEWNSDFMPEDESC